MNSPRLFLFIGYPGAGKTTVAKIIEAKTGAVHLWADRERIKLFKNPTHDEAESVELYNQMNKAAEYLLKKDKSVIFDTNFNHFKDRQHLREIAKNSGAETVLIWLTTPIDMAKQRAVNDETLRNGYPDKMTDLQFLAIAKKLEPPTKNENAIKIDGTNIDETELARLLNL